MGIPGLWPLLEPTCVPVSLESLEGKTLAIDVSIWIYQAHLGFSKETRSPHIAMLIARLAKLLHYRIRPIFVFDGAHVPSFKRQVLEERRLRKFNENILQVSRKRRCLEELAKGTKDEETVKKALTSPQKRNLPIRLAADEALFDLPSTSSAPVVTLSDAEDEDIVVERVVEPPTVMTKTAKIQELIDVKEQIRVSRLHPDAIPKKTDEFCQFQLARVLGKNRLDRTIAKLTKEQQDEVTGSDVKMAVADSRGGTHVISYDNSDEVQLVEPDAVASRPISNDWESLGLTLDHLKGKIEVSAKISGNDEIEDQFDYAASLELSGCDFVGKASMIEKFMKRMVGSSSRATQLQQDDWSSESGDDDFIDVEEPEVSLAAVLAGKKKLKLAVSMEIGTTEQEEEEEWQPERGDGPSGATSRPKSLSSYPQLPEEGERDLGANRDFQDFLTACGFPWIEAPGEAEAQCVELERLGLVDGIVSDDGDVWAFGAQNVYRHLFARGKNVQYYSQKEIAKQTNLTQSHVIEIAILSGGDYSPGIGGIGVVTAIEMMSAFSSSPAQDAAANDKKAEICDILAAIEEWLFDKTPVKYDRHRLRTLIEKHNELETLRGICNPAIVDAYLAPNVDSSTEPLRWKAVDVDSLRAQTCDKLGWTADKFDTRYLQAFEIWNEFIAKRQSYQKHMTSYVLQQSGQEQKVTWTRRTRQALDKLAGKNEQEAPVLICQTSSSDKPTTSSTRRRPAPTRKKSARVKRAPKCLVQALERHQQLQLSESSDSDF